MSKKILRKINNKGIIKDKVLILCSGETEKTYFERYKLYFKMKLQNVDIKIISRDGVQSMYMVNASIETKSDYRETWVVFDKDIDPEFDEAILKAKRHGIRCAFSNIAFEYWLLLHLDDKHGAMSVADLKRELSKRLNFIYDKNRNMDKVCDNIMKYISIAEGRAMKRHGECERDLKKNPSVWWSCSTVYELTKRLREWRGLNKKDRQTVD